MTNQFPPAKPVPAIVKDKLLSAPSRDWAPVATDASIDVDTIVSKFVAYREEAYGSALYQASKAMGRGGGNPLISSLEKPGRWWTKIQSALAGKGSFSGLVEACPYGGVSLADSAYPFNGFAWFSKRIEENGGIRYFVRDYDPELASEEKVIRYFVDGTLRSRIARAKELARYSMYLDRAAGIAVNEAEAAALDAQKSFLPHEIAQVEAGPGGGTYFTVKGWTQEDRATKLAARRAELTGSDLAFERIDQEAKEAHETLDRARCGFELRRCGKDPRRPVYS